MSQTAELSRVSAKLRETIKQFCAARLGQPFHAAELHRYVNARVDNAAPGSADRVLRSLRQRGEVEYQVLSRSDSLYRCTSVTRVGDL